MQNAAPADSFGSGVQIVTTDDIIAELAPMADVSPEEVNTVLMGLGYRPGRNTSGSFGWMMRRS